MATETVLFGVARHFLSQGWLPSQIAGLPKLTWPDEPQHMVSHESIHTYICSAVGTPLEHSSRPVMLIRPADAMAASALDGLTAKQRRTVQPMYQSLTEAQDKQPARCAEPTVSTGVGVCFCDLRTPGNAVPAEAPRN